jgi:hypothetical protein
LGIGGLGLYWLQSSKISPYPTDLATAQTKDSEALAYIVTYVIPLLDINLSARSDQAAFLLMLFVIGVVYVRSNLIYVNPLLIVLGYRIFEVTFKGDASPRVILTKQQSLQSGDRIDLIRMGDYLYREKVERSNATN